MVDIREINEKIQQESAFIELLNLELGKVIVVKSTCSTDFLLVFYPMDIYC
jgi:hypothetical protein